MAIASSGGHWTQLRRLAPAFAGCDVLWVGVHPSYGLEVAPDRFALVPDGNRWDKIRLLRVAIATLATVLRFRPHVIISTGAAPGFFALRFGSLLGIRTLWLDSIANADELSLSGVKASKFATLALTQWPELGPPLPAEPADRRRGTVYHAGAVL